MFVFKGCGGIWLALMYTLSLLCGGDTLSLLCGGGTLSLFVLVIHCQVSLFVVVIHSHCLW